LSPLPEGCEEAPTFITTEPGEKQCENCTHYTSEHMDGDDHCTHTMYYLPMDDLQKQYEARGSNVIRGTKLCPCKRFVSVEK